MGAASFTDFFSGISDMSEGIADPLVLASVGSVSLLLRASSIIGRRGSSSPRRDRMSEACSGVDDPVATVGDR